MKDNCTYHIDVTPEEDALFRDLAPAPSWYSKWSRFVNIKIITLIALVHLAGVVALFALTPKKEEVFPPQPPPPQNQEPVPSPTPAPTPAPAPVLPLPTPPPQLPPVPDNPQIVTTPKPNLVTQYTVKQGDTFYSIVKRYKLNPKTLIKLNNIQDPNKLQVGQVLKFVN